MIEVSNNHIDQFFKENIYIHLIDDNTLLIALNEYVTDFMVKNIILEIEKDKMTTIICINDYTNFFLPIPTNSDIFNYICGKLMEFLNKDKKYDELRLYLIHKLYV